VATLLGAPPALAQSLPDHDQLVVLIGGARVPEETHVGTVVVLDGGARIDGVVRETVISLNGGVVVRGLVQGDVVVFNGGVSLREAAEVEGDVVSDRSASIAPGATLGGRARGLTSIFLEARWPFAFVARLTWWLAASVSTLILGALLLLVAPWAPDEVAARADARASVALWGGAAFLGVPLLALLLLATLVGAPLGLGILGALALVYALGYVAGTFALGRAVVRRPRSALAAFAGGWVILRALALIPVLGGVVWTGTTIIGLGALLLLARRGAPDV
jgi:hypothetical protein